MNTLRLGCCLAPQSKFPAARATSYNCIHSSNNNPAVVVHNNILRTIAYSNFGCQHITPLYNYLNFWNYDIYKLELAKLMDKLHHELYANSIYRLVS